MTVAVCLVVCVCVWGGGAQTHSEGGVGYRV